MIHHEEEDNWEWKQVCHQVVTPEIPNPIGPSPNFIIPSSLLQNIVNEVTCSKRGCKAGKGSQQISIDYSGVTCSSVKYHCLVCGHTPFNEKGTGLLPEEAKTSMFNHNVSSSRQESIEKANGGQVRIACLENNVRMALAMLMNGMGGSESERFAGIMNLPNVGSMSTQFHRIEKDLLIPALLELQEEVLEEALIEEAKLELMKEEISGEKAEEWASMNDWDNRKKIALIGLQVSYDMGWQKRGTSGHGFLIGYNTDKIIHLAIMNKRCGICEAAKGNGKPVQVHTCLINYEGSSGGIESQAILEMIQDLQHSTNKGIYIKSLCADDDTSLRLIIKNKKDGGELEDDLIAPKPVSDPGHRVKNTVGAVWKLAMQPLTLSKVKKSMARTFEFGMRAAIRCNCTSDIQTLQRSTRAPLLHMFNVHTHCNESFCSIVRERRELLRFYLIFEHLFRDIFGEDNLNQSIDIPTVTNLNPNDINLLADLLIEMKDRTFVDRIKREIKDPANVNYIQKIKTLYAQSKFNFVNSSETQPVSQKILKAILQKESKVNFDMKATSTFRTEGDLVSFDLVSKKNKTIQIDLEKEKLDTKRCDSQQRKMDQSRTFFYPEMNTNDFSYGITFVFDDRTANLLINIIDFRKWIFASEERKKTVLTCIENLRFENEKRLWEIQVKKASASEDLYEMSGKRARNRGRMLDEFEKRQKLKETDNWFYSVKENLDAFFQIQFRISTYLTKASLLEINHSLSTQHNESLNKCVASLAAKDRAYNSSSSLKGRIAIAVCKTNLGYEVFFSRLCTKIGLRSTAGMLHWSKQSDNRVKKRREGQKLAVTKMRRSMVKKNRRTDELRREMISRQRNRSYIGYGGGKMVEPSKGCMYPGCFDLQHKKVSSKRCKYYRLDAKSRQKKIETFLASTAKTISP